MAGANLFNGFGTSTRIHPDSHCATWGLNYLIHKVYCRTLDLTHSRNGRSKTWIFHRYFKNAVQIVAFYHLLQDDWLICICIIYIYRQNIYQTRLHIFIWIIPKTSYTWVKRSNAHPSNLLRSGPRRKTNPKKTRNLMFWCSLFVHPLVMTYGNGQSRMNGGLYLRKSSINGGFSSKSCFITRGYPDSMQIRFGAGEKTIIPKRGDRPTLVVSWFVKATNDSYIINPTDWNDTPT